MPRQTLLYFLKLLFISCIASVTSCAQGSRIAKKQPVQSHAAVGSKEFDQAIVSAVHMPWIEGNSIQTLVNGDQIFPSMLKAIRSAKKSVTFETYAFVEGRVARQFVSAFCERAKAGVNVHVILDRIGGRNMGKDNLKRMRAAGVDVRIYHPFSILAPLKFNTRDHRKIMVVDGRIGFSGGCGIGDAWLGNAHTAKHWRETHYRVTGPVVAQLQKGFNENWIKTGGSRLTGPDYFPPLRKTGTLKALAFNSAPLEKRFTIPHLYRQAMASARKSIIIENSYVYLDKPIMQAILDARKRGVHVELILASNHTDSWPIRYLSVYQYDRLLKAGVHIYEYQKSMLHCKVMVIDELFTVIGSANFDPRSLYINDESNMNVMDKNFAREQLHLIKQDKAHCKQVLKAPSPNNPLSYPPRAVMSLIGPQL